MLTIDKIRRVVTAHNSDGKSYIAEDSDALPWSSDEAFPGMRWLDLWSEQKLPADNNDGNDHRVDCPVFPAENGLVYRILQIDPEAAEIADLMLGGQPHPGMHKTQTIDMAYVMDGEIWLVLEEEERLLQTGDIFIQRGTNHAWSNRGDKPCSILGVLAGAKG